MAEALAKVLREERQRRGITLEVFARRSGITARRLQQFEAFTQSPKLSELVGLAKGFRLQASTLLRLMAARRDRC